MADESPKKRSLSEISHLFLSSIRDRQGAEARPTRTPPGDVSIDLTPEEFAQMYGGGGQTGEPQRKAVPICAVVAAHLNGKQFDRTKEYARSLAARVGRVGLIELDSSELRLMCFEPGEQAGAVDAQTQPTVECVEPRQMIEALEEMNWDIEQWLVLLPNPRTPEARAILRELDQWVLLSTCDHDGVVCSYRMLKGLAESSRPLLTLALLGGDDEAQVTRVFQKLSGVCRQFLDLSLDFEPAVTAASEASEHLVLLYRPTHDKAQLAAAPQWAIVSEFIASARIAQAAATEAQAAQLEERQEPGETASPERSPVASDSAIPVETFQRSAQPAPIPLSLQPAASDTSAQAESFDDVIDLPGRDVSGKSILTAVLRKAANELIECPLRPPMCLEARLAVGRDRSIVLLAVANQGLHELQFIGQAYRWLKENRELIGMALPQFAIDPQQTPCLRLLVDRADMTADILQPMLQSQHITVQAYRKLRWGQKLGVFLEAA